MMNVAATWSGVPSIPSRPRYWFAMMSSRSLGGPRNGPGMKSAKYAYAMARSPMTGRCHPVVRRPASSTSTSARTPNAKSVGVGLATR
jgi:hypothetical protein